jgi:hypothetical protein
MSVAVAYVSWGQGWSHSILATIAFMLWPFFFYLRHINYPVQTLENLIVISGIIYIILYFFQLTHSGTVYFGYDKEFDISRGIPRVIFPGGGLFYLTIFIALSKFSTQSQYRWFWLMLIFLGLIVTIFQVTRQFIAATILIYIFHFFRNQQFYKKFFLAVSCVFIIYFIVQSDNPVFKGLKTTQEETVDEGKNYIRVQSGLYFLTDFSPSIINRIFGNGVPYNERSTYGRFSQSLESLGYYLSDVCIIASYAMFGILSVIGFITIWIKSFTIKLPPRYYYLKYYLWFLLFTCFTSDSIYTHKYLISTVIVLYCYQTLFEEDKLAKLSNNGVDLTTE